jgi:hypothetical protein
MGMTFGPRLGGIVSSTASSLYLLLDATDRNCHSGTFEDTWLDLSGNDRHAVRPTTPNTTGSSGTSGNPDQDIPRFDRDGLQFYGLNANGKFAFVSSARYTITNTANGISVFAMIKTTSTKSTTSSSADAGLNILGDTNNGVVFGFGIENGKVKICFYSNITSTWGNVVSNASVNDGNWHQIGFVLNAGNPSGLSIYIDGQLDKYTASVGHNGNIIFDSVGTGYNAADMYVGTLRNLMIFNSALSAADVLQSWEAQKNLVGGGGAYGGADGKTKTKGGRFFAEFKYRQIINYAYVACGYKDASPWKNVHKTVSSTDQTTNLGTLMQYAASYTSGACSLNIFYMWATYDGFPGTTTQTSATNMFTESAYSLTSAMNMIDSRDDCATIFQEHDKCWISGGGNASIDRFNFWTETMATSTLGGGISSFLSSFSDQYYGYWGSESGTQKFTYATETPVASTTYFVHSQQKGISSKMRKGYCGNEGSYNAGYNLRRWSFPTDTNIGNVAKPDVNCGEENFTMGQDWQYMLGNYNGAQNNNNWKWFYATDTGLLAVAGLSPTAQAGQSSGHCAWRE